MNKQKSIKKIEETFNKVFKNTDAFGKMFQENINSKILLYPTEGFYLTRKQFNALINTSKILGEESFYLAIVEGGFEENSMNESMIYNFSPREISLDTSYENYLENRIVLENALFSKNGTWGVIISHEDHAVLGGSNEFIETFKTFYPNYDENLTKFIQKYESNNKKYDTDLSWISDFLQYVSSTKK